MSTDDNPRAILETRWTQVAAELAEIAAHRIVPERLGMSDREIALLREQDEIEFRLGELDFEERGGESGPTISN